MRSVRVTLLLGYIGILAVVLFAFSACFYFSAASSLARDVDKMLALQADGVAETIFAFWRAERAAPGSGPGNWLAAPTQSFEGDINQGGLEPLLGHWAEKTGNLNTERPIRVIDGSGKPLSASDSFTQLALPLTEMVVAGTREGRTLYETFPSGTQRIRLVTRPIRHGKRLLYLVQVASSLAEVTVSLERIRLLLVVFIPATLGVVTAVGFLFATRAFDPVRNIITRARRFSEDSLHERLEIPDAHDELEQLDLTFNEMLLRLERALKRMRQFSAAASHELRTPLTVMKGEIGVALRKPRSLEEYRRVLQTQLVAVDDMTTTVDELLTLAQGDAVEGETEWHPVELGALAQHVCDTFQGIAKAGRVRIEQAVEGPVWVRGERRLLARLLANLLDNAIKHTPAKGRVTVLVERRRQEACVIVQDTGQGIPPDRMPRLFDQFFAQQPATNGARVGGLGLGLCRWIADTHHGSLEVASTPGQGTTFTIQLPILSRSLDALSVPA